MNGSLTVVKGLTPDEEKELNRAVDAHVAANAGNVQLMGLADLAREFLQEHNSPPPPSFHEQMQKRQQQQEEERPARRLLRSRALHTQQHTHTHTHTHRRRSSRRARSSYRSWSSSWVSWTRRHASG